MQFLFLKKMETTNDQTVKTTKADDSIWPAHHLSPRNFHWINYSHVRRPGSSHPSGLIILLLSIIILNIQSIFIRNFHWINYSHVPRSIEVLLSTINKNSGTAWLRYIWCLSQWYVNWITIKIRFQWVISCTLHHSYCIYRYNIHLTWFDLVAFFTLFICHDTHLRDVGFISLYMFCYTWWLPNRLVLALKICSTALFPILTGLHGAITFVD